MNQKYEVEKARLEEEAKRISEEQANEALKLKEAAEAERRAINEEKEAIIADIEQRRVDAQAELDQLVEQAKSVIAEAEEATKTRDEMIKVIEEAKVLEAQKAEVEAEIASKKTELEEMITSKTAEYDGMIANKTAEYDGMIAAKTTEYDELIANKKNEYDEMVAAKQNEIDTQAAQFEAAAVEWDTQINAIKADYEQALKIIEEAKNAEMQAESIGQEIILNAEKQAVVLKESALTESEKGAMKKLIEEKDQKIDELEKERLTYGPKEYSVESVANTSNGIDNKGIGEVLAAKAKENWKLVSSLNDNGTLDGSLGGNGSRVVLIFERIKNK
jgi:DNA repair exonuclease SbcCD ATPase subunit